MPPRDGNDVGCNKMPAARGNGMQLGHYPIPNFSENKLIILKTNSPSGQKFVSGSMIRIILKDSYQGTPSGAACLPQPHYIPGSLPARVSAFNSSLLILILPAFSI